MTTTKEKQEHSTAYLSHKTPLLIAGGVLVLVVIAGLAYTLINTAEQTTQPNSESVTQQRLGQGRSNQQNTSPNSEDQPRTGSGRGVGQRERGPGQGMGRGVETISITDTSITEAEKKALHEALADEYKAEALYTKVIEKHGEVRPFINIIRSEQQHSASLINLYNAFGLEVLKNTYFDTVEAPATVQEACQIGVDAEIANMQMYDRLLEQAENQDIRRVFENLSAASENKHLPAFERCD